MTDFSQSGEQRAILRHAKPKGRFLDLGASDGITYSNTYSLALRGWSGVCVEPAPWAADHLSRFYAREPVETVNALVTAETTGLVPFYYSRQDHLSSTDPDQVAKWRDVHFERIIVCAITLDDLLAYVGERFDFVSIDTEGSSLELLQAYRKHPSWESVTGVCVEAEDGRERAEIMRIVGAEWKLVAATPNNMVLKR